MLSAILSYSELALDSEQLRNNTRTHLEEIKSTSQKSLRLTNQLLAFLRDKEIKFEIVDMAAIVKDMQSLIEISLSSGINTRFNFTQDMTPIQADKTQIEQMILNLAINARDAMPDGGVLTISLYVRQTAGKRNLLTQKTAARCVVLCVEDTGTGMSNEIQEKIFTPYYTTKPVGSGTGLGMHQVLETVNAHQGSIDVKSQVNVGTKIEIDFPFAE